VRALAGWGNWFIRAWRFPIGCRTCYGTDVLFGPAVSSPPMTATNQPPAYRAELFHPPSPYKGREHMPRATLKLWPSRLQATGASQGIAGGCVRRSAGVPTCLPMGESACAAGRINAGPYSRRKCRRVPVGPICSRRRKPAEMIHRVCQVRRLTAAATAQTRSRRREPAEMIHRTCQVRRLKAAATGQTRSRRRKPADGNKRSCTGRQGADSVRSLPSGLPGLRLRLA
jgi:hypothetical protein